MLICFLTSIICLTSKSIKISAKFNPKTSGGKGGTNLQWNVTNSYTNPFFIIYSKKNEEGWNPVSAFNHVKQIRVLNVYPYNYANISRVCGIRFRCFYNVNNVTFKYGDSNKEVILPKSASLKVWMEGGTIIDGNKTFKYEPAGYDKNLKKQLINVTEMDVCEFEKNPNIINNYDCFFFGTWDSSACQTLTSRTIDVISKYIDNGNGVIIGHDVIFENFINYGFNRIREKFGILLKFDLNKTSKSIDRVWRKKEVIIREKGIITNYPHKIGNVGDTLKIPETHTNGQRVKGKVWIDLKKNNLEISHTDSAYLSIYNNTAFIQTGHSNCQTSEQERKVIANLIYFLCQKTNQTSIVDHFSQDLENPIVSLNCNYKPKTIEWSGEDRGTNYSFKVIGFKNINSNNKDESNIVNIISKTGIKEFLYTINGKKDYKIKAEDRNLVHTNNTSMTYKPYQTNQYFHLSAIDYAENLAETKTCQIPPFHSQTPFPPQYLGNQSKITHKKMTKKSHFIIISAALTGITLVSISSILFYNNLSKIDNDFKHNNNNLNIKDDSVAYENPLYNKNGVDDPFKNDFE